MNVIILMKILQIHLKRKVMMMILFMKKKQKKEVIKELFLIEIDLMTILI